MKLSALILILCLTISTAFAQQRNNSIILSADITTESKDITGFDKIEVSEDFKVYIKISDGAEKVEIEANENFHDYILVEKHGKTLKISTKDYSTRSGVGKNRGAEERLVAYITANQLTEITAEEDVVIEIENELHADRLTIDLDEDCTLKAHLVIQDLIVRLVEDSELDIEGSAQTMTVKADEDSVIDGYNFEVGQLDIKLKEDSEVKLTVNGDIDLEAYGDSNFYYRGNATFTRKKLRGDSEVN